MPERIPRKSPPHIDDGDLGGDRSHNSTPADASAADPKSPAHIDDGDLGGALSRNPTPADASAADPKSPPHVDEGDLGGDQSHNPNVAKSAPGPLNSIQLALLEGEIIEALQMVFDPELPVDIYNLGLIYDVNVAETGDVRILMTLTSPACPVAESLPIEVENAVAMVPGVRSVRVELTWDPPYSLDRMPDHVKLELGLL